MNNEQSGKTQSEMYLKMKALNLSIMHFEGQSGKTQSETHLKVKALKLSIMYFEGLSAAASEVQRVNGRN